MIHGWIDNALRFGYTACEQSYRPITDDELQRMAEWLSANPTSTYEDYRNANKSQ